MKIIEKRTIIELTDNEINELVEACNYKYKALKEAAENGNPTACELLDDYRHLRNTLANLIGRSFMGEDA